MRHSQNVRTKGKRSFREKQVALNIYVIFYFSIAKSPVLAGKREIFWLLELKLFFFFVFFIQLALQAALLKKKKQYK